MDVPYTLAISLVLVIYVNVCRSQTCSNVTSPAEGSVTCSEDNALVTCTAVCSKGFEFMTFTQVERRYCVKATGQWVNGKTFPQCIPFVQNMCKSIEPPNHGVVRCEDINSKLVCNAKCNDGYMFESQDLEVKRSCEMPSGIWLDGREFPNCIVNDTRCSAPLAPINGLVNCNKNVSNVHCSAVCKTGYEFSSGERFIEKTCDLYTDVWSRGSGDFPTCNLKKLPDGNKCSSLPAQNNTHITCTSNGLDLICSAQCASGYEFQTSIASVVRVCEEVSGVWLQGQDIPECVAQCDKYIISGKPQIADSAFSASSILNTAVMVAAAERVRIDTPTVQIVQNGISLSGGWRPAVDNLNQFIQIDLSKDMMIYGIVTKGRDKSNDYVTRFRVLYSSDGRQFVPYGDEQIQDRFFSGNSDSDTAVTNIFKCPFSARFVRVNPLEWKDHIGLRMDLIGCPIQGGDPITTSTTSGSSQQQTNAGTKPTTTAPTSPAPCTSLLPPVNGIINCEQSYNQLVCSAICKDGYAFETGETIIKRSCDRKTGLWEFGKTYPDCRVYSGAHTSPVNVLPHKCVGRVADCKVLPNGDFQTCGDCHYYASCSEGYVYVRPCPVNLVFDSTVNRCLYTSSTCIHKPPIVG